MGVQLTPGQRYLLDILQKKLIESSQHYARLSRQRRELLQKFDGDQGRGCESTILNDYELAKLREKIKRISARQKLFTSEIINGNGTNTIPKESFFKALGLVTKETLNQLNSKSSERRRRTTANPRFSHEAIQAKKALQKPKVTETRVTRDKQRNTNNNTNGRGGRNNSSSSNNNNNNNNKSGASATRQRNNNNNNNNNNTSNSNSNSNSNNNTNNNNNAAANRNQDDAVDQQLDEAVMAKNKAHLWERFQMIRDQVESKARKIRTKLENRQLLDEENQAIANAASRAALLEVYGDKQISSISQIISNTSGSTPSSGSTSDSTRRSSCTTSPAGTSESSNSFSPQPQPQPQPQQQQQQQQQPPPTTNLTQKPKQQSQHTSNTRDQAEAELLASQVLASLGAASDNPSTQLVDTWLKCDESLDGVD